MLSIHSFIQLFLPFVCVHTYDLRLIHFTTELHFFVCTRVYRCSVHVLCFNYQAFFVAYIFLRNVRTPCVYIDICSLQAQTKISSPHFIWQLHSFFCFNRFSYRIFYSLEFPSYLIIESIATPICWPTLPAVVSQCTQKMMSEHKFLMKYYNDLKRCILLFMKMFF